MKLRAPSTAHLHQAILSLVRRDDRDCSERSIRCHMLYHPTHASYVLWVQRTMRPWLSAALARALGRPFAMSSDFWILQRADVESLVSASAS